MGLAERNRAWRPIGSRPTLPFTYRARLHQPRIDPGFACGGRQQLRHCLHVHGCRRFLLRACRPPCAQDRAHPGQVTGLGAHAPGQQERLKPARHLLVDHVVEPEPPADTSCRRRGHAGLLRRAVSGRRGRPALFLFGQDQRDHRLPKLLRHGHELLVGFRERLYNAARGRVALKGVERRVGDHVLDRVQRRGGVFWRDERGMERNRHLLQGGLAADRQNVGKVGVCLELSRWW